MKAVIVAGSDLDEPLDDRILAEADLVVAADSGADALMAASRRPDLVVGDMDSIDPSNLETLRVAGAELLQLPSAKDETDLEVALRVAVDRGADEIVVFGALGGPRLDHLIATILLLTAPWLKGRQVRLVDPWHEVFLTRDEAIVEGRPGDTLSLLPLSPTVEDVVTEGLAYPLNHEDLHQRSARGVSNELTGTKARVVVGNGNLLAIHYRKERKPYVHFHASGGS